MTSYRLNEEQRKLVEDNIHLVDQAIGIAAKKNWNLDEDSVSICYIGLCQAAARYKEEKGATFKTYAIKSMLNELRVAFHNEHSAKRLLHLRSYSLNYNYEDESGNIDELINLIVDDSQSVEDSVINRVLCESIAPIPECVKLCAIHGYTYAEVGESMGICRQRVHQLVKKYLSDKRDTFIKSGMSTWQ